MALPYVSRREGYSRNMAKRMPMLSEREHTVTVRFCGWKTDRR